ncbi:uncharacterized protein LOC144551958 isoform X2 [Carex rostrata]
MFSSLLFFSFSLLTLHFSCLLARGKTKTILIENSTDRQVTFSKRKSGVLKKARELAELCATEVVAIIYSERGKLSQYSSKSIQEIIQRYRSLKKENLNNNPAQEDILQRLKEETENLSQKIETWQKTKSKLSGENLDGLQVHETHELETEMVEGLRSIRLAKSKLIEDEIAKLQKENSVMTKESRELHEKMRASRMTAKLLPLNKDTEGSNLEKNYANRAPCGCFEVQGLDAASRFQTCNLPHKEYCILSLNQRLIRFINDNIDANPAHNEVDDNIIATISRKSTEAKAYQLQLLESGSGFQNNSVTQEEHCLLPLNPRPVFPAQSPNILTNNNIDGNTLAPIRLDDNINANPVPDRVHVVTDLNLGLPGQGGNKM